MIYIANLYPHWSMLRRKILFHSGDTGLKTFKTKYGVIGVGICWDQWFPEAARIMALQGAEILFYPTAIGSEPVLPKDSKAHWQNVMCGHAGANIMPVIASNRYGEEKQNGSSMTFFGSSFIADEYGNILEEMDEPLLEFASLNSI